MSVSINRPRAVIAVVAGGRRRVLAAIEPTVACELDLVNRLLWLRLTAQRLGRVVLVEEVDDDLRDLLDLVGVAAWLAPRLSESEPWP